MSHRMSHRARSHELAWQREMAPAPDVAKRNLDALRERLATGEQVDEPPPADDEDSPQPAKPPAWSRAAAAVFYLKAGALSVSLGMSTLAAIHGASTLIRGEPSEPPAPVASSDAEPATRSTSRSKPPASPAVRPAPAAPPAPPVQTPTRSASSVFVPASEEPAQPSTPTASDRLRAEIDLMAQAEQALHSGDDQALLRTLERHRSEFPRGAMIEERQAWLAVAACRSNRPDARMLAEQFLGTHPTSTQAARVRHVCEKKFSSTDSAASRDEAP